MMNIVNFPHRRLPAAASSAAANDDAGLRGSITVGMLNQPDQRTDPAALVAVAVRFGVMGQVDGSGVPPAIRTALREHAAAGSGACAAVLDWLDTQLLTQLIGEELHHD